jgi:hypothetical protein
MPAPPIACSLSADGLSGRLARFDALAARALLERTATRTGLRVRLRDTPEIERGIRELIAAESACCPFLEFELRREDRDLVLEIMGPDEARPMIDVFFARAAA